MNMLSTKFVRVLCSLMLCASLAFAGCTDDPLGGGENTEQGGNNGGQDNSEKKVGPATVSLEDATATTATFVGNIDVPSAELFYCEITVYYTDKESFSVEDASSVTTKSFDKDNNFNLVINKLGYNKKYNYWFYVKTKTDGFYSEVKSFTTTNVTLSLSAGSITAATAQISGTVEGLTESDNSQIQVGMIYSAEEGKVEKGQGTKLTASSISSDNAVSFALSGLTPGSTYYYCFYVKQGSAYVYGEVKTFVAGSVSVSLSAGSITATTAQITGTVEGLLDSDKSLIEVGMFYSSEKGKVENGQGTKLTASVISPENTVSFALTKLSHSTTYYYCSYVKQGDDFVYSEVKTFVAGSVSVNLSAGSITATTAQITGAVEGLSESDKSQIEVGMFYSTEESRVENGQGIKLTASEISSDNTLSFELTALHLVTTYYYCSYVKQGNVYVYGEAKRFTTTSPVFPAGYTNLSATGTANCYIVSNGGNYSLLVAKGNQRDELLHSTNSASVLWETFGTSTTPNVGDLIKSVSYAYGVISFQTADAFKEGNAVIAAKDASGNILWSWHIWLTDQPQGQVYYNNAGTMMDRNLGATSAEPGDVGALGLLYQWGRKDPFLGSSSISSSTFAKSTITWPSTVPSNSSNGTIAYATANPTTFIKVNNSNYDWYYTGSSSTDNTRWTTSESNKSIYDPCPAGWRVPDGGSNGVWSKALGSSSSFTNSSLYNSTNEGMNFSGKFGSASIIWYPASGCRDSLDGSLDDVGYGCTYWSASPYGSYAYSLGFNDFVGVYPSVGYYRASGQSVRCLQE